MHTAEATNENQNPDHAADDSAKNLNDRLRQAIEDGDSRSEQARTWSELAEKCAERGSLRGSVSWWARRAAALHVMAGHCDDDDLLSAFEGRSCTLAMNIPGVTGITHTDVRDKLAVLVRYLLDNRTGAGSMDELPVLLAASARADMVIINGSDTQLPDELLVNAVLG
jgi:hypothetical protein